MLLLPSSVIFMQIQLENGWMTISWSERDQVCGSVCIANNYLCLFLLFPPPQCANQCSAVPALTNIRRAKDSQWVINISTHRKSKYSMWAYFKSLSFTLVYIRLLWCWGKKRIFCKYQKLKQISQTGLKKKNIFIGFPSLFSDIFSTVGKSLGRFKMSSLFFIQIHQECVNLLEKASSNSHFH